MSDSVKAAATRSALRGGALRERLDPPPTAERLTLRGREGYCRPFSASRSNSTHQMPTQSKWQSLPTEAINPVSLSIDKAPVRDIIDMVVNEDRKVVAAVQKEKERI